MIKYFLSILIIIIPLHGCAVTKCNKCEKNGRIYGWPGGNFLGQWDDYYKCALSYTEGECYSEAMWALNEALKRRAKDQRRARSYGIHFVDDYFPHREKGIIYYLEGNYGEAKSELEISLSQYRSEKALVYLDKVRREIMKQEGVPVSEPRLTLKFPSGKSEGANEIRTNNDPVIISGTVKDDQYVSEITMNGKPIFIEASDQLIDFKEYLKLDQGRFEAHIIARNLLDGSTERKIIIHVDRSGPVIILEDFDPDVGIQGYIYDESGVLSLTVNSKEVIELKGKDVAFTVPVDPDIESITLQAKDELGNETKHTVNTSILASISYPLIVAQGLLADTTDTIQPLLTKSIQQPEITLKGWSDQEIVFLERVHIQGEVTSKNDIEYIAVNDTSVLHRTGNKVVFNHSVGLEPGRNTIKIEARNRFGTSGKNIIIIRRIPEAFKLKYRYRLAIYPFKCKDKLKLFRSSLLKCFADRNRFQIMVRENPDLDDEYACHSTLFGIVNETRNGVETIARVVDIRTSKILTVEDSYSELKDSFALKSMIERLVEKIHRKFELAKGNITQIKWWKSWQRPHPEFVTDFENKNVKEEWPLVVYRESEPRYNLVTGEPLGSDARVIGYECFNGRCETPATNEKPGINDKVITQ
ncbi:hypothetical protein QUF80_06705 [Desulfococcaceae bacterium HSG8]|nr:hypothetical protein [Desulfococcaceae bacterium HSG8]